MGEQIRQRVAMTSFLQLNNEPAPSNKAALVVATGDLDDWRRRMNEETKDLKQVSEQCNVDAGKRYKEDLEAATDVFEEDLQKAKAASKEDEVTSNEAYEARKKSLSGDKNYADSELQRSRNRANVAGDRHASARATLTKTNRERESALSEAAKKRDEARSKADAEHASATADDKEESRRIRFDAQKNWDDTRPLKQTKCSNRAKTLEDEADLLRKIRHKLDEAGLTTKEEIISQTLSFEGVTAAQLNTSETKNKIADELRNQLKIESPATLEITSIQDRKNKDTTTEETEAKAEETEEAVTLLQIHKSG